MKLWRALVWGLIVCATAVVARGDLMAADPADNEVRWDGTFGTVDHWAADAGEWYGGGRAVVIPFLLPNLGPGVSFTSADFKVRLHSFVNTPDFTLDVYGLGRRASSTILASDFYAGPLDTSATLIEEDFLTSSSALGDHHTSDSGDAALVAYLNSVYAGGAGAGEYAFIRLNPNVSSIANFAEYTLLTQDAGGSEERPVITYSTAIPEPATCTALAMGLGFLLFSRSRMRRV